MKQGREYIVFPLDVPSASEALELVRCLDGAVGMFKVGLELFIQEGPEIVRSVRNVSQAGIFLDLKLHDISATVGKAMERVAGMGVDLVTVHLAASRTMLEAAVLGAGKRTGVLGVTVLTDNDSETLRECGYDRVYVEDLERLVIKRARMAAGAGFRGIVCSGQEVSSVKKECGRDFLAVTPGIRPEWSLNERDDQKRVTTPAMAVGNGADLIVVGRPIRTAPDPRAAAEAVGREIDQANAR